MCPAYLVAGSSCLTLVRDPSGQGSPTPLGVQTPLDVGGTARVAPVRDPGRYDPLFPLRREGGAAAGPGCPCACLTRGAGRTPRAAAPGFCTGGPTRPSESYPGQRRPRGATWLPPPPLAEVPGTGYLVSGRCILALALTGLSAFRKAPSGPAARGGPSLQDRASLFPSHSLGGNEGPRYR